ncbi:MAG: AMP-binding protein [Gammaproteobacteria bacterium]|nr:AMP-binding protein [Gammaproteobacteria bacterium]
MEKIWLKSYPPQVPSEIDPDAYQSLIEIFKESCHKHASRPAFYNMGVTLTYKELEEKANDFAAYLQQELKLKKGDRFAIMLPNVLQYPIALFGALSIGLVVVNVNPLYTAEELAFQLDNSGATTILVLENFAHTVEKARIKTPNIKNIIITKIGDLFPFAKSFIINFVLKYIYKQIPAWSIPHTIHFKKALELGKKLQVNPVPITNSDIAFLQYTGGTTGISKGAILTHRNLIANIQQADAWFGSLITEGKDIIITALPMYHIFSLTANCLFFSKIGGLNVLITNPRDIKSMIKDLKKFKFTVITGVNTLFNALLKNSAFPEVDFSALRLTLGGGMSVQKVVAEKWQNVTRCHILEAYGLTETSPCVTINPTTITTYNGTIGLPVSSTEISLFDEEGNEVGLNTPGEIAVRGPQVMRGYWQNEAETKRVFHDDWLLTGDIAEINAQGFVRLLERKKDMILVSGFNVYPNEIEDVLMKVPGIREVAVVGVPNENSGETVKAFIVKDDPQLTEASILQYARQYLTPYKVPKQIEFRDELPKTNVGKILRRALRDKK